MSLSRVSSNAFTIIHRLSIGVNSRNCVSQKMTTRQDSARTMGTQSPRMSLSKKKAMSDERINLEVCGLKAFQKVTLVAGLTYSNAVCVSYGHFEADSDGYINLLHTPSTGGTYKGKDSMGLFWSMVPAESTTRGARIYNKDIRKPFEVNIVAVDGYNSFSDPVSIDDQLALCSTIAERWYFSDDVTRLPIREGRIRGTLFIPKGEGPFPGVVDIFGTGGGLYEYRAALLASKGFLTLALAYFNYDDLPEDMILDYDYFDEAVSLLLSQPKVMKEGVGAFGSSKGAEIVLHMAAVNKSVKASVALNGTAQYYFGDMSYKGRKIKESVPDMEKLKVVENDVIEFGDCYEDVGEGEYIPLENADQCEFLLVDGLDDRLSGTRHTPRIVERLEKYGKTNFTRLSYPGCGHIIEAPYLPLNYFQYHRLLGGQILSGGMPVEHALAQEHSWSYIVHFLSKHLEPTHNVKQSSDGSVQSKL